MFAFQGGMFFFRGGGCSTYRCFLLWHVEFMTHSIFKVVRHLDFFQSILMVQRIHVKGLTLLQLRQTEHYIPIAGPQSSQLYFSDQKAWKFSIGIFDDFGQLSIVYLSSFDCFFFFQFWFAALFLICFTCSFVLLTYSFSKELYLFFVGLTIKQVQQHNVQRGFQFTTWITIHWSLFLVSWVSLTTLTPICFEISFWLASYVKLIKVAPFSR